MWGLWAIIIIDYETALCQIPKTWRIILRTQIRCMTYDSQKGDGTHLFLQIEGLQRTLTGNTLKLGCQEN